MAKDSIGILLVEFIAFLLLFVCRKLFSWNGFYLLNGLVMVLILFTLYFFRDPDRSIPKREDVLLSPADGKVVEIAEIKSNPFIPGAVKKISIFLSVWNVHINRVPVSGKVFFLRYQPGKFKPAYQNNAGDENEQMWIGIDGENGKVLIKQIAGILARRIVCRLQMDSRVQKGDRFGMIKFGSRTELFFPSTVKIMVHIGDRVKAGQTLLGEYVHEK